MSSSLRFIRTMLPDRETAERLARQLVEKNLAACVSIESSVESYYWWDGDLQQDEEIPLLIKTTDSSVNSVKKFLDDHHPYDCPEIVVTPVSDVNQPYQSWVQQQTDTT